MPELRPTEVVITGVGSYMNIFEPRSFNNGEPKYSVCMLFSKKDKKQLERIKNAIEAAKKDAQTKVWKGKMYTDENLELPIHDGDIKHPDDPAFEGMYYINCKNKSRAAMQAYRTGRQQRVANVAFGFFDNRLQIKLPSGRILYYPNPGLILNQYGQTNLAYDGVMANKKWGRIPSYGPKFVENTIQATCRDLLAEAMRDWVM